MRRIAITGFSVAIALILFVVLFTFVKRPYEVVLLDRFGRLIAEDQQARLAYNWYFKMPTDGVVRIDKRLHLKTMPLLEFPTKGREMLSVRPFAVWRIVDPVKFRQKASGSDSIAESIMEERIKTMVGQEIGTHQLDEFFNTNMATEVNMRKLEAKIAHDATNGSEDGKIPGLSEIGIELADMGFSRIAFTPDNTNAVYTRMVAALTERARQFESTGQAEAQTIIAEGQRLATDKRKAAQTEAEGIKGRADREAGDILAAVNQTESTREFYQYWKSLDYLKASLAKNTILVLSSDSPLLAPMFQVPLPGTPAIMRPATTGMALPSPLPAPSSGK